MKKSILVVILLISILTLCSCNKEGVKGDVRNDSSMDSSEYNKSSESTGSERLNVVEKSNTYRYIKAFNTMESGVIYGTIIQDNVGSTKSVMKYYCYKYEDKLLSVIESNDMLGWAELKDGDKYYALNMQEKVYEKIDSISLNTYDELIDLFKCADSYETKGAREAIHLSNSEYGVNTYLDCTLETNGVHISIVKNDGTTTGKEFTVTVGKLKDEDKKLFDISDYEEQQEESSVVSENSILKHEELSIPNNLD